MTQPLSAEVDIAEILYVSIAGKIYDLRAEFTDIHITESVGSPFVHGWAAFNDLNGISEFREGYSGGYLRVKFRTNKDFPFYEKAFWIYKVGDDVDLEQSHQYVRREIKIFFATIPMQLELEERYSNYYENMYPHEIVEKVAADMLAISSLKNVDPTDEKITVVTNYGWTPMGIINHCVGKSVSTSNQDAGYVFYENSQGFHYVSLSEILKQPFKYTMTMEAPDNRYRDRFFGYLNKIISFKTVKHVDLIESWMSHRFGASVHYVDFSDIRMKEEVHDFSAYLPITVNLGTKTTTSTDNNNPKAYHLPFYGSNKKVKLMNMSRFNLMEDNHIIVTSPGDSRKTAGEIAKIRWPSKAKEMQRNESLDGNWMIYTIKHMISLKKHYINEIRFVKDALKTNTGPSFSTGKNNP
jgi:hypothetical protein